MIQLNVANETSRLKAVVLGTAQSNGPTPIPAACYDPSSLMHVNAGTYPLEPQMVMELNAHESCHHCFALLYRSLASFLY